ncbi:phenylalanine--tRNA ligase subunit alpha [Candidatus Gottesmanbacteria bacterium]|nr:phenylalanine--tRNA ligase subunit alpha [Candidatus Gottesmanbacteria bacterium]
MVEKDSDDHTPAEEPIATPNFIGLLLEVEQDAMAAIEASEKPIDQLRIELLGGKSELARLTKQIRRVPEQDRAQVGTVVNQVKQKIENALSEKTINTPQGATEPIDVTAPGTLPPVGHLHIVTQAVSEITRIFERIGFTRVRHPEVDWDWYAFESLNMPPNHPARDEWETFFIKYPEVSSQNTLEVIQLHTSGKKYKTIVLTPHTSNGQVREMEKGKLPIRMINIAKCYRRQVDVSHTPMFHQFEGLYIDRNVSIMHLKGVFDYFVKQFYGPDREIRLRPFHFQFTEPSFEVDISCGICHGTGYVTKGQKCRLCKEGWLEMAGSGMVHPVVLKNGGVDPAKYSGFAFGWGIERAYMMKSGTKLDDLRLIYSNDVRFSEQF